MSESVLLKGGVVVTMDSTRRVIVDGAVGFEGGVLTFVGKSSEVGGASRFDKVVDVSGRFVMPGIVCAHTHLYGIALRGAALQIRPSSDFLENLQRVWWPLDEKMNNDDAYATALGACMELALNGTTTFADTYSAPLNPEGSLDAIAKAVNEVGIRGVISFEATERRSAEEGRRGLEENVRFLSKGGEGLAKGMISLHASFTISDDLIAKGVEAAKKHRAPLTIHVSEGPNDVYHNIERYGKRTVERLHDTGLLGPWAVLAHCVHLNKREIQLLAASGTHVAHNPMSNMLNAVGVMKLPEMLEAGVNVGLGNDGYVFDGFENMRAAFLIHRVDRRDPSILSPQTVVEMATVNAAKAYGLSDVGSLQVGKKADVIVVRPEVYATPLYGNVYGYLVNGIRGGDVEHVFVNGVHIVRNRRFTRLDKEKAESKVVETVEKLWQRLGHQPPEAVEPLKVK
ncbi:MAG: amidohydrolase [Candidatus Caldarchaeum sp.]|nr:amidohydrolase [Candidatus Caldarchaeum sp.]MDW8434937.1 amidohydrolase [Candidatus Caldarchaeum sp.]